MKRIKFFLLASAMLLAAPAFLSSCKEDAPGVTTVAVTGVTLNETTLSLKEGETATLVATVQPAEATNKKVAWQSSDMSVATVDADGKVTALKADHTATITVTTADGGKTATCTVKVVADYVDLGLSVKWATRNLGASKPSDYGDYYAWGETEPKAEYTWATYKWMQTGQSDWKHITKYTFADGKTEGIWYAPDGTFIGDGKTTLEAADDAATQKLGSPWRMPTYDEIKELLDNCTWTWTTQDGKNGYEVKGTNGNSIFVPAAGYRHTSGLGDAGSWGDYWSSSLSTADSDSARYLYFGSGERDWSYYSRFCGFPVRPVRP